MTGAGQNLRGFEQGYLNDQRGRFENDRDFALNQQIKYQQGILGQAVNNSPQNPVQETASPIAGMFGGAMQGASAGMGFGDWYSGQKAPSGGNSSQTAAAYQQVYGGGP